MELFHIIQFACIQVTPVFRSPLYSGQPSIRIPCHLLMYILYCICRVLSRLSDPLFGVQKCPCTVPWAEMFFHVPNKLPYMFSLGGAAGAQ